MNPPNVAEIVASLREVVVFNGEDDVYIHDFKKFRDKNLDRLVHVAVFDTDVETRGFVRWLLRRLSLSAGVIPASIRGFYDAKGSGSFSKVTVPAVNIRGLTYDVARAMFKAARATNTGAMIFEISRSEIEYTGQRPAEFTASVLAAALREGFIGPVFLQGDHFQFHPGAYAEHPEREIGALENLIREAVEAGFFNLDIDASTLVNLKGASLEEHQRTNADLTARMTRFIRSLEPEGVSVAVGGEIGEVGGRNSTVDDLRVFLDLYLQMLGGELKGISKVSIQSGTVHGGIPAADGTPKDMPVDFARVTELTKLAVSAYRLAGVVQHGASTLPVESMEKFPQAGAAEIHLATAFQNLVLGHPRLPPELNGRINSYLADRFASNRKPDETDAQFFYRTRKFAFGPFKQDLWEMDEAIRSVLRLDLEKRFQDLFKKFGVRGTLESVAEHVDAVKVCPPVPERFKKLLTQ